MASRAAASAAGEASRPPAAAARPLGAFTFADFGDDRLRGRGPDCGGCRRRPLRWQSLLAPARAPSNGGVAAPVERAVATLGSLHRSAGSAGGGASIGAASRSATACVRSGSAPTVPSTLRRTRVPVVLIRVVLARGSSSRLVRSLRAVAIADPAFRRAPAPCRLRRPPRRPRRRRRRSPSRDCSLGLGSRRRRSPLRARRPGISPPSRRRLLPSGSAPVRFVWRCSS